MMINREKVIKGLELCLTGDASVCKDCPYEAECEATIGAGPSPLRHDALTLLKEQQKLIDDITQRRANNGAFD